MGSFDYEQDFREFYDSIYYGKPKVIGVTKDGVYRLKYPSGATRICAEEELENLNVKGDNNQGD